MTYTIELPHATEEDFSGIQDGARAADNIYVDPLNPGLKEDEGIYDEIGKKGFEDDDDDDYDDVGAMKKRPLDDDDDFSYAKKNKGYDFDDDDYDLKKH